MPPTEWLNTSLLGGQLSDRHTGLELDEPVIDFLKLAEAMGIHGQKVEHSKALGAALRLAMASGKLELVEVCIKKLA